MQLEHLLLWLAVLVIASVVSSKLSDRLFVPVLLIFLAVGMLAGSEGIGGIHFDNFRLAKSVGIVALIFIIFAGGLDTSWRETRPVLLPGIILSTVGVLATALVMGLLATVVLRFSLLEGLLLGAIVSSTDAAAVFAVLKSRGMSLVRPLRPLLELESGSNDPMAVFLTTAIVSVMTVRGLTAGALLLRLLLDLGAGALVGVVMGRLIGVLLRRLRLAHNGLYPVAMVGLVLLTYAVAVIARGNGILAVYLAGLILGHSQFPSKRAIVRFHDSVAWLMQIVMFVTLGLLVFPSRVLPLAGAGLLLALLLMFVARPLGVLLSLAPFRLGLRRSLLVAWVGLRGAVPVILATFPLTAGVERADAMFNIVFFVVIASAFIQGTTIPFVARLLGLRAPPDDRSSYPIEFEKTDAIDAEMTDVIVPYGSAAAGRTVAELGVPEKCLILLVVRGESYEVPSGSTVIEGGDVLLVLANAAGLAALQQKLVELRPGDNGS
jgi:cell volume regulation protein A